MFGSTCRATSRSRRSCPSGIARLAIGSLAVVIAVALGSLPVAAQANSCSAGIEPDVLNPPPDFFFDINDTVRVRLLLEVFTIQNGSMINIPMVLHRLDCADGGLLENCTDDGMVVEADLANLNLATDCMGPANQPVVWTPSLEVVPGEIEPNQLRFDAAPVVDLMEGETCTLDFDLTIVGFSNDITPQIVQEASGFDGTCDNGLDAEARSTLGFILRAPCDPEIIKEVNCDGTGWVDDCQAGDTVQLRYTVVNNCTYDLTECELTDSNPECPANLTGCSDVLAGQTVEIHQTNPKTCVDGVTDLAEPDTATGTFVRSDTLDQIELIDTANFDCVECGVTIQKQVRCNGGAWVENCAVETGQPIEVRYVVTNDSTTQTVDNCSILESNPELASCVPADFSLPPGGSQTFECSVPCNAGVTDVGEPDTATVSCDCAIDLPVHTLPVDDDDTANFSCVDARIEIDKVTNGVDGAQAFVGDPIVWTYTLTNPGNVALANVLVTDDAGTPGSTADDFGCVGLPDPVGDANNNGLLDPGEVWTCTANGVATRGLYQNVGTVVADPVGGVPPQVGDADPSSYTGYLCDVDVNREVACDCTPGDAANASFSEYCETEADGTNKLAFRYTVENVGDLDAQLCQISDNNLGLNDLKSFPLGIGDIAVAGSTTTTLPQADPPGCYPAIVEFDEPAPGQVDVDCQCVLPNLSASQPVMDDDPAQVRVRTECAIQVDKQISCDFGYSFIDVGFDDDVTEFCLAADDMQPIELRYVIKNISMDPVSACTLADSNPEIDLSGCPAIPAQLLPDQEYVCQVQETCLDPSDDAEPNTAIAECTCPGGSTASDTDQAWFDCRDCDADVDRQISCDGGLTWTDEGYRDGATGACAANNGDPIQVRYLVRNRSVKPLNNCTITDSNAGILNVPFDTGFLATGFEGVVHTVDFACGAQFDSGGPDTVSIACDCVPTCQETNPFAAGYCLPNCPPDVSASDSDQSQLTCN